MGGCDWIARIVRNRENRGNEIGRCRGGVPTIFRGARLLRWICEAYERGEWSASALSGGERTWDSPYDGNQNGGHRRSFPWTFGVIRRGTTLLEHTHHARSCSGEKSVIGGHRFERACGSRVISTSVDDSAPQTHQWHPSCRRYGCVPSFCPDFRNGVFSNFY